MNNFEFLKNHLSFFKKIKLFYYQLLFSKLSIILFAISLIVNPIIIICIHFLLGSISDYSLLVVIIPLLVSISTSFLLVYKLFCENKFNYLDSIYLTSELNRKQIFILKFLVIFSIEIIIYLWWTIFDSIFLFAIKQNTLALNYFINFFINVFINILFTLLFSIVSIKFKQIITVIIGILMMFLFFIPSLFTRSIIPNDNLDITYQNNKISFTKIIDKNDIYYAAKINDNNLINKNPNTFINNTNIANYFIPSEWIISFYNSSFNNNSNYQNINSDYSLNNYHFKQVKLDNNIDMNYLKAIRGEDNNLFTLNSYDFANAIVDQIRDISKQKGIIDLNNEYEVSLLLKNMKSSLRWDDTIFNITQLETIRKITGIDTKYNKLFYLIKYKNDFKDKQEILKQKIINSFGNHIWELLEYVINSESTIFNLFNSSNILSTGYDISYYYPSIFTKNLDEPILNNDLVYIRDKMIIFRENTPFYLNNVGEYISNLKITSHLSSLGVNNEITWHDYINKISLNYNNVEEFISNIRQIDNQIIDFKLSDNYFNIYKYSYILVLKPETYIWFSNIIIVLVCLSMIPLPYLYNKYDIKNKYDNL